MVRPRTREADDGQRRDCDMYPSRGGYRWPVTSSLNRTQRLQTAAYPRKSDEIFSQRPVIHRPQPCPKIDIVGASVTIREVVRQDRPGQVEDRCLGRSDSVDSACGKRSSKCGRIVCASVRSSHLAGRNEAAITARAESVGSRTDRQRVRRRPHTVHQATLDR
jgi:hypothetical protein